MRDSKFMQRRYRAVDRTTTMFSTMPPPNYKQLLAAAGLTAGLAFGAQHAFAPPAGGPFACVPEEIAEEAVADPLDSEQRRLARHLARRFQVAADDTGVAVFAAYRAAKEDRKSV